MWIVSIPSAVPGACSLMTTEEEGAGDTTPSASTGRKTISRLLGGRRATGLGFGAAAGTYRETDMMYTWPAE